MKYLVVLLLLLLPSFASEANIDELLEQFHTEQDLSHKTKQENVGHLIVFQRDDIDKMRLKTLKDFIDYIPFVRPRINHYGFIDPYYETASITREAMLRVFIDEKEFYLPFGNNGLKILSNINLYFIDHVEVYFGVPSFTFGTEMSLTTIRLYTKKPKREDTSFIGFEVSNKNSYDTNAFSAKSFDDFSYLLSISYSDIYQPKMRYEDYELKRDSNNANIFSKFDIQNHSLRFFVSKGRFDDFLGESQGFNVNGMNSDNILLNIGYTYQNENDYKVNLDYTHSKTKYNQSTDAVLDVISLKKPPYALLPHNSSFNLYEQVFDFGVSKKYFYEDTNFLVGLKGRYKQAKINNFYYDNKTYPQKQFTKEDLVTSLYTEVSHSLSPSSLIVGSLKYDYVTRKALEDDQLIFGKLGYIYDDTTLYYKHYLFAGNLANQSNDFAFKALETKGRNSKEDFYGTSAELGYKSNSSHIAFLARYDAFEKENIFLPFYNYLAISSKIDRYNLSLTYGYNFSSLSKLDFNIAASKTKWDTDEKYSSNWYYNGYVRYLTSYGKFDFSNALIYGFGEDEKDFYSVNLAINYRHSRSLNFYFKANNIFDSGYEQTFHAFKIVNDSISREDTLENFKTNPREFFVGFEYIF